MTKIKIKDRKTGYHFSCFIFNTKQEMYDNYVSLTKYWNMVPVELNFMALVMPYEIINKKTAYRKKDIGTCFFYKKKLGAGLIAHEMLHCALHFDRVINKNEDAVYGDSCGKREERLGDLIYEFTKQFVNQGYKKGLF